MEISTLQIIAIFLFSCIAGMGSVLDEFQTHRPLIACTVIGLILGDLKTGIMLGGTLELIALGWMNVGAAQSPDSALASIISAILVIVGQQSIATGIAIALPVAAAGQVLTVFARTITVVFLAGGYLDLSLLAFGGVGVIMALLYIQLNPQWRKAEPHPQTTTITALDQLDD